MARSWQVFPSVVGRGHVPDGFSNHTSDVVCLRRRLPDLVGAASAASFSDAADENKNSRLKPLPQGHVRFARYSAARSMAAIRVRHRFALAMIAPASMSTSPRSRSFGLPAIQTSL